MYTQTKPANLLTTYLVYIKDSLGVQGSGVTEQEIVSLLRDCVALVTRKHGVVQPAKEVLHFASQFQPSYDLEKLFPGMCTCAIDKVKATQCTTRFSKHVTFSHMSAYKVYLLSMRSKQSKGK